MKNELSALLMQKNDELSAEQQEKILFFYELLVQENEVQNLTRLISPLDFYQGHLLDVCELLKTQWLTFPVMDIGSGCGVPGLLAALMSEGEWVLSESEVRKAQFLEKAVEALGLRDRVRVTAKRAEDYLKENNVPCLAARAVGPVDRIYTWIRGSKHCSTWNNLILFKGPSWEEEWDRFQASKYKKELSIQKIHSYEVGVEKKKRVLVFLSRN